MTVAVSHTPTVLILGAGRPIVKSVLAARKAGFRCVVADDLPRPYAFEAADAGIRCALDDIDGLARVISDRGPVDGAVATNEAGVCSIAALAARGLVRGLPTEVSLRLASKLMQRQAINRACPQWSVPFHIVGSETEAIAAGHSLGWPVILKPDLSGGGSRGVSLVSGRGGVPEALAFAVREANGSAVLAERALDGPQFSAEVLVSGGRTEVVAIGRKRKSRAPYRVDLAVIYPGLTGADRAEAERMLVDVARAAGVADAPAHIEFALTAAGPRPIEIGGRVGGGFTSLLVAASTGCDPFVEACRVACGLPAQWPDRGRPERGAVYGFLAYPPGRTVGYEIPNEVAADPRVLDVFMMLPEDGLLKPLQWTSQRVGMMAVTGESAVAALAAFDRISPRLRVKYADGSERPALTDYAAEA